MGLQLVLLDGVDGPGDRLWGGDVTSLTSGTTGVLRDDRVVLLDVGLATQKAGGNSSHTVYRS